MSPIMKSLGLVVGTRPDAIKMIPVYLALKKNPLLQVKIIATAQHRYMLDQQLKEFSIDPDIDLDIMQHNQTLSQISVRVIKGIQRVLTKYRPDALLVHGDTTTCLCSALAAFHEKVPVAHVEAGLRTYNFNAPWPEEMNRRLVDPICRWCLAPTKGAADNLLAERIPTENIFVTGNTVIDALFLARDILQRKKLKVNNIPETLFDKYRLILATGHRQENFGKPLEQFCLALRQVIEDHRNTVLVYVTHLNPNAQKPAKNILGHHNRIYLIEPISYLPFVYLMERSYMIITDSGGIQEEAPSLHKPVLVARETSERPEAINAGLAKLVGTSYRKIVTECSRLLSDRQLYKKMSQGGNFYGDGWASQRIANILHQTM